MAERNAARVLPEPVGAATSTCRPALMAGHACACASVGRGKRSLNQRSTEGWNAGIGLIRTRAQKSDIAPRARRSGWTSSLSRFAAMQDEGDMGLAAAHSTIN